MSDFCDVILELDDGKRHAFDEVREAVASGTGLPVFAGHPEPEG